MSPTGDRRGVRLAGCRTEARFLFHGRLKSGVSFEEAAFFRRGLLHVAQVTNDEDCSRIA